MDGKGIPFTRNYSTSDSSKTNFPEDFISEERINPEVEVSEHLYPVSFEVVNHLRRHTRSYMKKLGGLKTILELLRTQAPRRVPTYTEDSILVGNLEELANLSLQEIVQPLETRFLSFFTFAVTNSVSTTISSHNHGWECTP